MTRVHSKTDEENLEASTAARRRMLLGGLGMLGCASLLKGCGLSENPQTGPFDEAESLEYLESTAAALLGTTSIIWFDSYSELRAKKGGTSTTSTNVAFGKDVTIGGQFSWTTDTTSPDDGGTLIVPTGTRTGCWKRVFRGSLLANWFGLAASATAATNRVALQNAVGVAIARKVALSVSAGTYWLDGTIQVGPTAGFKLNGAGSDIERVGGTYFAWGGPATAQTPMFDLKDVANSHLRDFAIITGTSFPLAIGIRSYNTTSNAFPNPGGNTFERISMDGTTTGIGKGFEFSHYLGLDANNSENLFLNCRIANFGTAAWSFESGQCKSNAMYHCQITGAGPASSAYGVTNKLSGSGYGGSFKWFGGNIGQVDICFGLFHPGDDMLIQGVDSEGCRHLLTTVGIGVASPVIVQSVRFACNGLDAAQPQVIDFRCVGPLLLLSSTIEASDPPRNNAVVRVQHTSGTSNNAQLVAIGNTIGTLSSPAFQFVGNVRRTLIGNTGQTPDSGGPYVPDVVAAPVGNSAGRPADAMTGQMYLDTQLGKPIWCLASSPMTWIDATGVTV